MGIRCGLGAVGVSVWLGGGRGCRLSVVGCRLSVVGCRLSVVGCRLSVAGRRSPVAGRRSPVAGRRSPVAGRRSPVAGRRSPVAGRWSLVAGRWSLVAGSQVSRMADVMAQALGGNIGECRDERMQSSTPRHPPLRSDRPLRPIRRVGAPSPRSDRRTPAGTCACPR
ncbi:hypothetical protein DIJ60_23095 [Burkholderia pseudomallei]|nr:hypothetical protein DIJ60_23095 [Burkholderia pseudomallei]